MRVITGSARGRKLKAPDSTDVRVTTDRVKEALFSAIQFDIEGRRVLDLFSGSGQLGIEALSRGAVHAVFVERSREFVSVIKENVKITNFEEQSVVVKADALSYLSTCAEKFDIVFIDPPYQSNLTEKILKSIERVLNKGAVVVCETEGDAVLPEKLGEYLLKQYKHGKTMLSVYR